MDTRQIIDELNKLVVINNDRIEGYETASDETDEKDFQLLFASFAQTSQKCKQELLDEITRLGGDPEEGTRITGKIYRMWMDFKAAITGKNRKAILNSCEYGEDIAVHTYDQVLNDHHADLTVDQIRMISAHRERIKADHDHVKQMRDALAEV